VIVIATYFNLPEGMPDWGDVRLVHFTPNFVSTLSHAGLCVYVLA
jgi:hypothetical protein